jgi:8-oxo-dGTP pyrophosphatase MutT (NUDIX family)
MSLSVNIIIVNQKKEYLLQLRDNDLKILSPNYWCLFGGGAKINENTKKCILREIKEELSITLLRSKLKSITKIKYCRFNEKKLRDKYFYFYKISKKEIRSLKLNEGQDMKFFRYTDIPKIKILPWDYYGIVYVENQKL